jgi:predicted DNA-binding transcriptional regulator AlpA
MSKLLTLGEVAELSGLSYSRIHELATSGKLPAQRWMGEWFVRASDARKVKRKARASDTRRAVMVRVPVATYERWERVARKDTRYVSADGGVKVSAWLWALGDAAAGAK